MIFWNTSSWVSNPFTLWCNSGLLRPLRYPGRTPQHDHRRLLGIGAGDAVARGKPADAIGYANAAQPVNPRIRVRRKSRVVFPGHVDQLDRALFDHLVKRENIITRDTENVLDPKCPQPLDQVFADRDRTARRRRPRFRSALGAPFRFGFLGVDVPDIMVSRPDGGRDDRTAPSGGCQRHNGPRASSRQRPCINIDPHASLVTRRGLYATVKRAHAHAFITSRDGCR